MLKVTSKILDLCSNGPTLLCIHYKTDIDGHHKNSLNLVRPTALIDPKTQLHRALINI